MPILSRACNACGHRYDLLSSHGGQLTSLDREDIEDISCPECGSDDRRKVVGVALAIETGGEHGVGKRYPFYSFSFGCEVRSKAHHQALMRHHDVHEATPDDVERAALQQHAAVEDAQSRGAALEQAYRDNPVYRDWWREVDSGQAFEGIPRERRDRMQEQMRRFLPER
jgi:predicted nucleic acid-binding Zn ribbon protein